METFDREYSKVQFSTFTPVSKNGIRRWLIDNTFAPDWLPKSWQHPLVGIIIAVLFQFITTVVVMLLLHLFPAMLFISSLLFLSLILLALNWGAIPGYIALLAGIFVISVFEIIQPAPWDTGSTDTIGILLFCVVGLAVSTIATQLEGARRNAEAAKAQLSTIFESMTDGVVVYDATGKMVRVNSAYRQLLALDHYPEHVLLSPDERGRMLRLRDEYGNPMASSQMPVQRMLRGEALIGKNAIDIQIHTFDEREIQLNVSGAAIYNSDSQLTGGIMIFRDVTERRRLERRTYEALEALSKANQLKDEFIGIASHELRTPLTTIKAATQMAIRRIKAGKDMLVVGKEEIVYQRTLDQVQHFLLRVSTQVDRLIRLVNELLDVSRIQAQKLELQLETYDLSVVIQRVVDEFQQSMPNRSIILNCSVDTLMNVVIDADRIEQVITNYLTNALKYSSTHYPVEVIIDREEAEESLVRVSVADKGPGLPAEETAYIWDRFYRSPHVQVLSGSDVGLGMGLHICKTIIERHNGHVGVSSIQGEGSVFWFTLPLSQ